MDSPSTILIPSLANALMADALGVADPDAMHGILRQLVKASVKGEKPDAVNLAFMISMMKSIKPRDSVEAMLVAQMVSVHVMAMRCAHHLASAEDIARQDRPGAYWPGWPGRFRPRSRRSTAIAAMANPPSPCRTCRSGMAATPSSATSPSMRRVIVSDKRPAPAVTVAMADLGATGARSHGRQAASTGMSDHVRHTAPMLASPRCGAKIRSGGSCRAPAVRGKRRCRMHGGAPGSGPPRGNRNARKHGLFTQGRDRRAQADSGLAG